MRALTRMRTLAAACALLLFVSGMAAAWAPERPIDRTDSPPPPMVGDPDEPGGSRLTTIVIFGSVFIVRLPAVLNLPWRSMRVAARVGLPQRTQHAR